MLPSWLALLECEAAFQQTYEEELKKSIHHDAKGLIDNLVHAQFFMTYPTLITRRFEIEKKFLTYFDRKVEAIKVCHNFELHDTDGICHKEFSSEFTAEVSLCIYYILQCNLGNIGSVTREDSFEVLH